MISEGTTLPNSGERQRSKASPPITRPLVSETFGWYSTDSSPTAMAPSSACASSKKRLAMGSSAGFMGSPPGACSVAPHVASDAMDKVHYNGLRG